MGVRRIVWGGLMLNDGRHDRITRNYRRYSGDDDYIAILILPVRSFLSARGRRRDQRSSVIDRADILEKRDVCVQSDIRRA